MKKEMRLSASAIFWLTAMLSPSEFSCENLPFARPVRLLLP
jgi:hypothetical protein